MYFNIKNTIIILLLFSFISLYGQNHKQKPHNKEWGNSKEEILTTEERQWLNEHPDITLGGIEGFEPFLITHPDGSYAGMLVDLLNIINERLDTNFKVTADSWPKIISKIQKKEIDGALSTYIDRAIKLGFLPTKENLFSTPTIYTMDNGPSKITGLDDLKGKTICIQENSYILKSIIAPIKDEIQLIEGVSDIENLKLVFEGKADACIAYSGSNYLINKYNLTGLKPALLLTNQREYSVMSIRPDYPELVTIINKALHTITEQEYLDLISKWSKIDIDKINILLTDEEGKWLSEHNTIKVACDSHWNPIEFRNKNGEFMGASIEYLKEIEKILGISFDICREDNWQKIMSEAKANQVDMFACISETQDSREYLSFSKPYLNLPIAIFAQDNKSYIGSLKELEGKHVAVVDKYATEEWLQKNYPKIILIPVKNTEEGVSTLQRNDTFAFIGNLVTTGYYISQNRITDIKVIGNTPYENKLSMAVREDWPIFIGIIEKALNAIPQDRKDSIYNKWLASKVRYEQEIDYSRLWQTIAIAGAIILGVITWNYKLGRAVRQRTQELSSSEAKFRTLVSNIPGISYRCINDKEWTMVFISSEVETITGYPADDFIYNNARSYASIIYPEDSEYVYSTIEKAVNANESFKIEYRIIDSHGQIRWVVERGRGIYDSNNNIKWIDGAIFDITEQKLTEQEIKKAEAKFRLLYEATNDGVILLTPNGITESNNKFFEMTGLETKEQLIGMHPADLSPQEQPDGRNSLDAANEYLETAIREGSVRFEFLHVRQDNGNTFTLDVLLTSMEIEGEKVIQASVRDITERKKSEDLIKNYNAELEREVNNQTIELKKATSQLIESEKMATIGQIAANVAHEINTPLGAIGSSSRIMQKNFEELIENIDTEYKIYKEHETIIKELISRIMSTNTDISPKQMRELKEEIIIKLSNEGISDPEVAASFLTGIKITDDYEWYMSLFTEKNRTEIMNYIQKIANIFHGYNIIDTAIQQSSRVVNALREYSYPELKQNKVLTDITKTLETSITLFNNKIKHGIELKLDYGKVTQIQCHPHELSQVWSNIISNAIQAMENNGKLSISVKQVNNNIEVAISDSGPGIPNVIKEHIFEPLFTTKNKGEGTGLGLDITKRIVDRHNGSITFETEEGIGTTFIVTLPIDQDK